MIYRTWQFKDILPISELEKECFPNEAWSYKMLVDVFDKESFSGVLAEEGGEVVGYGGIVVAADCCDVCNIAVTERYRRGGVAYNILNELTGSAKKRGVEKIFLEVRVSNAAAMGLYLKCGFKGLYARKRYYPDGEDCLVMAKEL